MRKSIIGNNVEYSKGEREEDLLELLFRLERDGIIPEFEAICSELKISVQNLTAIYRRLVQKGYAKEFNDNQSFGLTVLGQAKGSECFARHQHLTQFIAAVCGMEEMQAEKDACRIEHVMSDEAISGIMRFLKFGEIYERTIKDSDMHFMFEPGSYSFYMSIYDIDGHSPRTYSSMMKYFSDEIGMKVAKEGSCFIMRYAKENLQEQLNIGYSINDSWNRAEQQGYNIIIPTKIFSFTVTPGIPLVEGSAIISIGRGDAEGYNEPAEEDMRQLSVHIWKQEAEKSDGTGR